jgi:creatinine deaminase
MPLLTPTEEDRLLMRVALAEAQQSYAAGGIPVGGVMVRDGLVIAAGHNRSRQTNDPTSHGETDCIRNAGLLPDYRSVTLYTTLSPCPMCTGAILFLGIPRLVIGERETFPGDVDFLVSRGLDVVLLDDPDCIGIMRRFIAEQPAFWEQITSHSAEL